MINGGVATIYITDMDRAVTFYTETLGLKLVHRVENYWAQVHAGKGLMIGLHPKSDSQQNPGTPGATVVGLEVSEPIESVIETLKGRGAQFTGDLDIDDPVKIMNFTDPDGNQLYLYEYFGD